MYYEDLNSSEQKTLDYIKWYMGLNGFSPSISDISNALNIKSTSTVHKVIASLEEKNYIKKQPNKNRSITIIEDEPNPDEEYKNNITLIPLVGVVHAGIPVFAEENIEDLIPIPNDWLSTGEFFMLRVKGDSMIDAGMYEGDLLIVQKINTARNGEIVVALVDDEETTVKRFYMEKDGRIRLQPENSLYEAIYSDNIKILGRVKKSIRSFF